MKLLDVFLRGRRQFNEQVDSLFADIDYDRESAKIDLLLRDMDPRGTSARVASLMRQAAPADYRCERPGCDGMYLRRRKGRRGPFLGCSNYPECRSIKDAPADPDKPYERREAWKMVTNPAPVLKRWWEFERSRRRARRGLKYLLPGRDAVRKGSVHGTIRDETE